MLRFTYWVLIIFILFIPVLSTGASGNNKPVDPSSVIQVKDNLLTVKVRDIPLRKVLMEIANQIPIKIAFFASAEEHLVADFSQLSMEKGLKKLLRGYNYCFTYGREESKDGEHEIRKVIILTNRGESQHRRMEPAIAYTEEPPLSDDPYDEDMDILEEDMPDPLEGSEQVIVTTGGPAHEPLSVDPYDKDPDILEEDI